MPPATRNWAVGSRVQKPTPKESIFKRFNLNDVLSENGRSSSLQRDDTPMRSPVTDAPPQPSPAVSAVRGAILRKENSNCLVYFSNKLVHMDYQKAKDELHHDNVKKGTAKLHCKDDEADLIALKTKEEDVNAFYSKIDSVLTSQRYHPNRCSTAIKLKGDERVYIMAPTKAQSVLTKAVFDEHNNKPHASDPSQGNVTHTSPSIVRSIETPSPLPKSEGDTKMGNSQKCSGKYLVVGKDLKLPNQEVTIGTPCMVRDANNIHTIMLWSEIEDAQRKRTAVFQDTDYSNNGLHPAADRDFLLGIKGKGESSKITMEDAILWKYQSKQNRTVWYKTVFSKHQDPAEMEKLYRTRNEAGDDSRGFIRSSANAFVKAGQSKAALDKYLKNTYPVLWEEYTNSLNKGSARDRSATPEAESSPSSSEFNRLETTVEELKISVNEMRESFQLLFKDRK
ncbi:hypothetical protein IG631_22539 [Alternaria alternata]|nr:hypothetical protein IG631_22539 [Alternaria alternata]